MKVDDMLKTLLSHSANVLGLLFFVLLMGSANASEEESVSDTQAVDDINQLSSPDGPEIDRKSVV